MPPDTPQEKSVLFHVGLPKAGSTFLQKQVFPAIADATFLNITSANETLLPKVRTSSSAFLADPEAARAAIAEAEHSRVIVSAEGFVGNPYQSFQDHEANAADLKTIWPEANILLIIRRQDHFCQSLFGQSLRKGFPYPPTQFLSLDRRQNPARSLVRHFDYRAADLDKIVRSYESLFGESRVVVLPLELLVGDPSGFVEAIRAIGPYDLSDIADAPAENTAYSKRGYQAARLLNVFCFEESHFGSRLLRWIDKKATGHNLGWRLLSAATRYGLRQIKQLVRRSVDRISSGDMRTARILTDDQLAMIRAHFTQSNLRLSTRKALNLDQYGYF